MKDFAIKSITLYVFIKSPWVPVLMPAPAADFCSRNNLRTTFQISFIFWQDWWPWCIDYLIWFWLIFVMALTLNFQGQIWNLLYLSQKLSSSHKTKSKYREGLPVPILFAFFWPTWGSSGRQCKHKQIRDRFNLPKYAHFWVHTMWMMCVKMKETSNGSWCMGINGAVCTCHTNSVE